VIRVIHVCILGGLGLASSGCMTQQTVGIEPAAAAEAPPVPLAAIKKALLADRARIWKDPDSVRGAMIGEPYWCPRGLDPVPTKTCICIEANAKNSYDGVEKSGFQFVSPTEFTVIGKMGAYATCGKMTPFPEMNGRGEAQKRS
jgi:hypothetical protein